MASSGSTPVAVTQTAQHTLAELQAPGAPDSQNATAGKTNSIFVPAPTTETPKATPVALPAAETSTTPCVTPPTCPTPLAVSESLAGNKLEVNQADSGAAVATQQDKQARAKPGTPLDDVSAAPVAAEGGCEKSGDNPPLAKTAELNSAIEQAASQTSQEMCPAVNGINNNDLSQTASQLHLHKLNASQPLVSASCQERSRSGMEVNQTGTSGLDIHKSTGDMDAAGDSLKAQGNKAASKTKLNNSKSNLDDGQEPEKKAKISPANSKEAARSPEQVLELMDKTFEQRRKIVTKQMPTIPELKGLYPDLFTGKQLLLEFQRITKIDIDQKIQEFCVRYATAVIELARNNKEASPVLARWEQAKQENDTLRQYWDMVTALCLLPLHFGENFVEMVLEIGDDEEVIAQGKIVPTLVARGNIFRTDEFFLIAENTVVQEFEEFTIAFASLYSSYWVFNMEYPETVINTYNYIQRCIVRQREPGTVPAACKNFTKLLQKWNKGK